VAPRYQGIDSIEQIQAEAPRGHARLKVLIGCANHTHVDNDFLVTADALKRALLQDTQHLGLGGQWHIANFIEKK
jgi:hypothetical protein